MDPSSAHEFNGAMQLWQAVELFSPQSIPRLAQLGSDIPAIDVRYGDCLPWETAHPLQRLPMEVGWQWSFDLYFGIFPLERLREVLQQRFGQQADDLDERIAGESALFACRANAGGCWMPGSELLSGCAWAQACLRADQAGKLDPDYVCTSAIVANR